MTNDLLSEAMGTAFLEEGIMLCLFPDGRASEFYNNGYMGTSWRLLPDRQAIVIGPKVAMDTIKIVDKLIKKGRNYLVVEYKDLGKFEFQETDKMLKDFENDPFHPINNQWRIKATKEETELELKKRIQNFVKHYALILKAAMERESQVVSFQYSKGIIKIYNGGIGAVKKTRIPEEWKRSFYNEEQAITAYNLYRNYLKTIGYKGASSANWVKGDYHILLALFKGIDEDIKAREKAETDN